MQEWAFKIAELEVVGVALPDGARRTPASSNIKAQPASTAGRRHRHSAGHALAGGVEGKHCLLSAQCREPELAGAGYHLLARLSGNLPLMNLVDIHIFHRYLYHYKYLDIYALIEKFNY